MKTLRTVSLMKQNQVFVAKERRGMLLQCLQKAGIGLKRCWIEMQVNTLPGKESQFR